jgi:tRNA1(Val) A37 N6-methylase TrmN6
VSVAAAETTEDAFLGGRVRLRQPRRGYRAATDPVLLAAAVPARAGESVLDLGCGAGAAMLCLAARVPGVALSGLEREADYAALARENAALNGIAAKIVQGDVAAMPAVLRARAFDHAMMNPPFHPASAPEAGTALRDRARRADTPLAVWIAAALARLRPRGRLALIHRAEALPEILAALAGPAGEIAVRPLAGRAGRDARRVIVTARKGAKGPFRLAAPLVLHEGPAHLADRDDFTAEARAILRDAAPLAV